MASRAQLTTLVVASALVAMIGAYPSMIMGDVVRAATLAAVGLAAAGMFLTIRTIAYPRA